MSGVSNTQRLRSLLNAAKDSDDRLTVDEIARRTDGRIKRSTASNLTKELYRSAPFTREQLEDIARGFGIDYEVLRLAHLADMNLLGEETPDAAPIAPLATTEELAALTPRQRAALGAVVRSIVEPEPDPVAEAKARAAAKVRKQAARTTGDNVGRGR